jgi:UDP-N-acetylglucosamine diphosphorylase/glucosamine-1-phosphate N-acetyltransferase
MKNLNKVYIYEDEEYRSLIPLTYLRPVFDLCCGMYTVRERTEIIYGRQALPLSRFHDTEITLPASFINGRSLLHERLPEEEAVFVSGGEEVGFNILSGEIEGQNIASSLEKIKSKLRRKEIPATIVKRPWELMNENESMISKDFALNIRGETQQLERGVIGNKENLYCEEGAIVYPGVYLNVENGPIIIRKGAKIVPPTIIDGPVYIGEGAIVDGAKIRSGTTIGRQCRIGGEVECSVFSSFSSKHHEGFVGHSYIGEWVNMGALTTTSDLKNTYGTVKVPGIKDSRSEVELLDTALLKIGSFIGDHAKTGIGMLLDTGSVVGCFVNIYGGGIVPKYVPPFSWGTRDDLVEYRLSKAIEIAGRVMPRRKIELTQEYESRIRKVFESRKA